MTKTPEAGFSMDSGNLILFIYNRRKPLFIIGFIAAVVSIVISFTIKPRFLSEVVLFPASGINVSQALVSTASDNERSGILSFGEEEETEQMLQILRSEEIKHTLVRKYNLLEHYRIKPTEKYKYTMLDKKMKTNIKFRKTEYMSVSISVLDEDPQLAADMANDIAALLDSTMNRMQKKRAIEAFKIVSNEHNALIEEIAAIEDSLTRLGEMGIYDVEAQSKGLNEAYLNAQTAGNTELADKLEKQIEVLGEHGGRFMFLKEFLEDESERLSLLKDKYTRAKVDAQQNLPHTFIVNRAELAEKKTYPKKSIIVLMSVFSAVVFGLLYMIVENTIKKAQL